MATKLTFAVAVMALGWMPAEADLSNIEHVKNDQALLTLQVPTWIPATDSDTDAVEAYFDSAGTVVRISTNENMTFRLSPATALENFEQDEYDAALTEYRSVRDCLVESERDKQQPDLTRFDWTAMPNHGAAYACFVLIFTSYRTAADVMWWMASQRMLIRRGYGKYRIGGPADHISQLSFSRDFGVGLSGGFAELPYEASRNPWPLSSFEADDYTVNATFSKSLGLVSISIIAHRIK